MKAWCDQIFEQLQHRADNKMLAQMIRTNKILTGLMISLLAQASLAQNLNLELPDVELIHPEYTKANEIDFSLQNEKYSADPNDLNGYNNFLEAKLRAKAHGKWSSFKAHIDAGATYSLNVSDYSSIYAPEAYISTYNSNFEVTLGRKLFNWSHLDSFWQLGLWQPDFKWNYLEPVEQGLTGVFFDLHTSDWQFLVFGSPLFIPEQSAPFNLSNGSINSKSPWFSPPAKYVQLFSGRADINYNLNLPDTSKIVSQFSTGLALQWNPKPFSVKFSYVYKPRNTLALPVDAYLALQPNGSNAPVSIYPKVVFHHLAALDLNYATKDFSLWLSSLAEVLNSNDFDANLTYQVLSNQVLFSPGFEWVPFSSVYSTKIGASGLFQNGGDVTEKGSLSSSSSHIFSYPLNYRNASQLRLSQPILRQASQTLDFNLKWIEEFHDKGSELLTEVNYQYQLMNIFIGANLLGSNAETSNSGFIPRYRDNSMVYGGASIHY